MQYFVTQASKGSDPVLEKENVTCLRCSANDFAKSVLASIDIQPHYQEIGANQFDDLLYGAGRREFGRLAFIQVLLGSSDDRLFCERLVSVLNYMDILSRHLSRVGVGGRCELILA